jgi:hypothetical protein
VSVYTIIRNFRGSWPSWCADVEGGETVFIYIRYGEIRIGVGNSEQEASDNAVEVPNEWGLGGVSDCTDALVALRKNGYNFVAPHFGRQDG